MRVFLFKERAESGEDPYEAGIARAFGEPCVVEFVPLLSFAFCNLAAIGEALETRTYAGLIVTSPRAASAVCQWVAGNPGARLPVIQGMRVFCVGRRSAVDLESLGITAEGTESGSANALAACIIEDEGLRGASFLHPCGDKVLDTLGAALTAAGMLYTPIVVYKSVYDMGDVLERISSGARACTIGVDQPAAHATEPGHSTVVETGLPLGAGMAITGIATVTSSSFGSVAETTPPATLDDGITRAVTEAVATPTVCVSFVFFSPGGVSSVLSGSRALAVALAAGVTCRAVAIGPTTADALSRAGVAATVCETPSPDGVVAALSQTQ